MPGSSNFLVFNESCFNQESDAEYAPDSTRLTGITFNQILSSLLGNKMFYQSSIAVAALAASLASKGYNPNDGSANPPTALVDLTTVFNNIITTVDVIVSGSIGTTGGHVQFGTAFGGLILEWGYTGVIFTNATVTFPFAFVNNVPVVMLTPIGDALNNPGVVAITKNTFQIQWTNSGTSGQLYWFAIGN